MTSNIFGSGLNSVITLYRIHQGSGYFRKDLATKHSQVKLLQTKLNSLNHSCGTPDGKYGDNTVNGVKAFQREKGLQADGLFGRSSLIALENAMGNIHLDPQNCTNSADIGAFGCYDLVNGSLESNKYKQSSAMRIIRYSDAISRIGQYAGEGNPLTVASFMSKLDQIASVPSNTYSVLDCANYVHRARNNQGATGSSSELAFYTYYFGSISDLGGYNNLIPGMELFQGFRKTSTSPYFYASHIGVYAGKYAFSGGSMVHAVYQSSPSYSTLAKKYPKSSGPNLTSMSDAWNYWGWSKYIIA